MDGSESSDISPAEQIVTAEQIMTKNYDQMVKSFAEFGNHILDKDLRVTNALLRRGSDPYGKPLERAFCAALWKHTENFDSCRACTDHPAAKTCSQCELVRYCGKLCMEEDIRTDHRQLCQFVLSRQPFNPFSFLLPSLPTLSNPPFPVYGLLQDLGGSPAAPFASALTSSPTSNPSLSCSVLKLPKHLRFLFPCAYDLRNVLVTVCQIPEDYKHRVTLFINSAECILAVRDVLILEILCQHGPDGIDTALALWFSTALTTMQDFLVLKAIRQLTRSNESSDGSNDRAQYECRFPRSSTGSLLRAELRTSMMSFLHAIASTFNETFEPRRQYWEREEEHDDKEVKKSCASAAHLASWSSYHTYGLLLPFGSWDAHFLRPNRLRYSTSMDFIARYRNDVLCGWDIQQLIATGVAHGASPKDLYGCLFFHVRDLMETFLQRIGTCRIELRITQFEPGRIAVILQDSGVKFHRIDACALAHYNMNHSIEVPHELSMDPELLKDVRRYLWKLGKHVSKQYIKTLTLSDIVGEFGKLLEKDASAAWPSLLLTASLDWASRVREQLKNLVTVECDHKACLSTQYAQERYPNMMCCMKDLLGDYFLSYVKENNVDERAKQTTGLERKSKHQIISPNCIPVKRTSSDSEKTEVHYFNLLFSGFTFLERFQEWGWQSAKGAACSSQHGQIDEVDAALSLLKIKALASSTALQKFISDSQASGESGEIVGQTTSSLENNESNFEVLLEEHVVDGLVQLMLEKPIADDTPPPDLELSLAPSWLRHSSDTSGQSSADDQPSKDAAAKD